MQEYVVKVYDDRTEWYQNNKLHRLDGPAKEFKNGTKVWYQNNEYHRLDGPAVECKNGDKAWYQNNLRHRIDGPAIEYKNGIKIWLIKGNEYTEEEFKKVTEKNCIENKVVEIEGKKYKLVSI